MLRFIMPRVHRTYTVKLVNVPDCYVEHQYILSQTAPATIILYEHTHIMNSITNLMYLLRIKGNDLILDSCIETSCLGEATFLDNGYPYIRMPEKGNKLINWEYILFEDTNVYCTAKIEWQKINGIEYEVLTVKRTFLNAYNTHISTECYVAGHGLKSRKELTTDSSGIYLPDMLNYSLN